MSATQGKQTTPGIVNTLINIMKEEGGAPALYRGLGDYSLPPSLLFDIGIPISLVP